MVLAVPGPRDEPVERHGHIDHHFAHALLLFAGLFARVDEQRLGCQTARLMICHLQNLCQEAASRSRAFQVLRRRKRG